MFRNARGALRAFLFRTPINARLWLTYRCNYKCRMCGVWEEKRSSEMSLEEFKTAAYNLKKLGIAQVILTGGEPLLRHDIVEVIKIFKPHGFVIRIQTNAGPHVTGALLSRCYEAGLDDISVSLDTLDPQRQDRICGSSDVAKHPLRVIICWTEKYSHRGVIAVNVVISRQNFFELPDLIEYINNAGAFFNPCVFIRKFSHPSDCDGSASVDDFSLRHLEPKEVDKVFHEIRGLIRKNYKILMSKRILADLERYMKTGDYRWKCMAGLLSFDVMPTGELSPCCDTVDSAFEAPVAKLKDRDFLKQYKAAEFQKKCRLRRERCPGCLYACYRDPVYLAHDPLVQLEALYKAIAFGKIFQ